MIHLIICASQVLGWFLEVNKVLEAKETFLSKYKYFGGFSHFKEGRHLLPYFSQPFFNKIIMFLCSLKRKSPELFKTHPTFFSRALAQKLHFYGGHHVVALKGFGKPFEAYIIQWTTSCIWLAPSWLTTSQELKMRSQLSHTLFHYLIYLNIYIFIIFLNKQCEVLVGCSDREILTGMELQASSWNCM